MNYNKIIIAGRLTRDPELKYTPSGKTLASFSVAVNTSKTETLFMDVAAWDKTAELASKYLKKGSVALVEGAIQQQNWTDKNGEKKTKMQITAQSIKFGERARENEAEAPTPYMKREKYEDEDENDDIPF